MPAAALERLEALGKWMSRNGGSIYGTTAGEFVQGDSIVSTRKGETLFLHVLADGIRNIELPLQKKPASVTLFPSGKKLNCTYTATSAKGRRGKKYDKKPGTLKITLPERSGAWDTIVMII